MKIKWTKNAKKSFDKTIEFLQEEWSINSAIKFVRKVNKFIDNVKTQPKIGRPEIVKTNLRSFVISFRSSIIVLIILVISLFGYRYWFVPNFIMKQQAQILQYPFFIIS